MQESQPTPIHDTARQLGNYTLVKLLGRGGFADVYLARHVYLGSYAAVKILYRRRGFIESNIDAFLEEARTAVQLAHPHIVRVLDFGVEKRRGQQIPYLVMDYAPNGTLRHRHPAGSRIAPESILQYLEPLAEAVDYIHTQGYIHRDIKPENMLLGPHNELWLSDFGITIAARHRTDDDHVIGTVAYMAPEQIEGHPCIQSDIYALGAVVYEWLSGYPPFEGRDGEGILDQHLYASPPSLCARVPLVTPAIEQVVFRALAKDPKERFESARAFAYALRYAIAQDDTFGPRPIILRSNAAQLSQSRQPSSSPRQGQRQESARSNARQSSPQGSMKRQQKRTRKTKQTKHTWEEIALYYGLNLLAGGVAGSVLAFLGFAPLFSAVLLTLGLTLFPLVMAFIRENMTLFFLTMSFIVTAAIFALLASNLVVFDVIYGFLLLLSLLTAFVVNINEK